MNLKLAVIKTRNVFLNVILFSVLCRPVTESHFWEFLYLFQWRSNEVQVELFRLGFVGVFLMVFFLKFSHLVLVIINVCYYLFLCVSCPILSLMTSLIGSVIQHFFHLIVCWKIDDFLIFFSSSFGRLLEQNVDGRGRNIVCERTLPSLLVLF